MNIKELATKIGIELKNNGFEVTSMNTLSDATSSEISFVSNSKYLKDVLTSNAGAI